MEVNEAVLCLITSINLEDREAVPWVQPSKFLEDRNAVS
jgi:hypothetical protein